MKLLRLLIVGLGAASLVFSAHAAGGAKKAKAPEGGWPFAGPIGELEMDSVQRGYQVYREVCAACHSMELLSFRNLGEKGGPYYDAMYPNANDNPLVRQFASEYQIYDPYASNADDDGYRPARPSDRFVSPYPDEQTGRAANNGAYPPDFSVITKARGKGNDGDGASYVYRLLKGYPEDIQSRQGEDGLRVNFIKFDKGETLGELIQPTGQYYNPYMAGDATAQWIGDPRHVPYGGFLAMAPQLPDDRVEYLDGTPATTEQMAYDVAQFLHWAGDPKQTQRKSLGLPTMLYLLLLTVLLWFSYQRIWRNVGH